MGAGFWSPDERELIAIPGNVSTCLGRRVRPGPASLQRGLTHLRVVGTHKHQNK